MARWAGKRRGPMIGLEKKTGGILAGQRPISLPSPAHRAGKQV